MGSMMLEVVVMWRLMVMNVRVVIMVMVVFGDDRYW